MNMKSMFGKKPEMQHSHSTDDLDRAGERAKQTAKKLEEAEEEFKAELMAKNEEMTAMSAALQDVQEQLIMEKRTQMLLDDQIEEAKSEIQEREDEAEALQGRVAELEGDLTALQQQFEAVVVEGAGPGADLPRGVTMERGQSSGVFHSWWIRDQEVETLRRKAEASERRVHELEAASMALRSLLLSHDSSPAPPPETPSDPDKPSVWEAAVLQDRELVKALSVQLQGKTDIEGELQAKILRKVSHVPP